MGYNEIMVAQAKSRVLRELGIGGEPEKVLTWDGDASDAIDTDSGPFVKVHDKFMDMNKVSRISIDSNVLPNFEKAVIPFSYLTVITDEEEKMQVVLPSESLEGIKFGIISCMPGTHAEPLEEGVYISVTGGYHISEITFAATTTPIKPEYLPGVCLPVVELSTVITAEMQELSAEEREKIKSLGATPFVLRCTIDSGYATNKLQAVAYSNFIADGGQVYGVTYFDGNGSVRVMIGGEGESMVATYIEVANG